MRIWLVLAACGGAATRPAPSQKIVLAPAQPTVTLHYAHEAAGTRWHEVREYVYDLTAQSGAVHSVQHIDKTYTIVSIDHDRTTEEHVSYAVDHAEITARGATKVNASPLEGRRYTIVAGPIVTHDDGSDVPADESAKVVEQEHFGRGADAFETFVDGHTFTQDVAVDLPGDVLAQFTGPFQASSITMRFRGMDGGLASFDMTIAMNGESGGTHIASTLTGRASFDPDTARTASMTMTGPVQMSGGQQAVGTASIQVEQTELR